MLAALDKGVVDGISLTGTHYIKYREEHGLNIHGTMLGTVNYAIGKQHGFSGACANCRHDDI